VADVSGHSLRAGIVTTAAERDVELIRIMEATRHKDVCTVTGSMRRTNRLKDTPAQASCKCALEATPCTPAHQQLSVASRGVKPHGRCNAVAS
jgi:hypothetical protein